MVIGLKKDIVYQQLRERILAGEYTFGEKLPNELEFAKTLKVGKVTLRSALARLEQDGLVTTIAHKGTFIATKTQKGITKKYLALIPSENNRVESPWHYILPGIEELAKEQNIIIEKCSVNFLRSMEVAEGVEQLKHHQLDGIFYFVNSIAGDEHEYLILKASGLPVIMPHGGRNDYHKTGFAVMLTDVRAAWSAGIKALVAKGHQYIGTIWNGNDQKLWRGFNYDEYQEFLAEQGCDDRLELIAQCRYEYAEVEKIVKRFMNMNCFPTAIICHSDFYALYVYQALKKMNIKIPDQVAVMGYSGYPGGLLCSPALSTVDLNYHAIGKQALSLMQKTDIWYRNGTAAPFIYTPYRLLERGSSNIRRIDRALVS